MIYIHMHAENGLSYLKTRQGYTREEQMKDILKEVISSLQSDKAKYCRITHKRGWLEYLKDGDLVFTLQELHQALRDVIDSEEMRPKGNKVFCLRRKYNFTIKADKAPYRTEEALERFIAVSNADNFYNQIPIGGGKESIDIGIKENDSKFTFVELKPWSSTNPPFYAVIESLKNLIEYKVIHERKIKDIPQFKELDLMILAPKTYYQTYNLIDNKGLYRVDMIRALEKTLKELSSEFQTNVSFMVLEIEKNTFFNICRKMYDDKKAKGQEIITLSKTDAIPILTRNNWKLLAAS